MRCREDPEPVVEYDIPPELHSYIDKEKVQKAKEKIEEGLKQTDMRLYYRFKIKNLLASNPTMQPYIEYRFYYKANWHVCDIGTELWIKIK